MGFFFNEKKKKTKPTFEKNKKLISNLIDINGGCSICPLSSKGITSEFKSFSGGNAPIFYVLEEYSTVSFFKNGTLNTELQSILSSTFEDVFKEKLTSDKFRSSNCIRCFPEKKENVTSLISQCCKKEILEDIKKTQPIFIIGCGDLPIEILLGEKKSSFVVRGRKIPVIIDDCFFWFFPTYSSVLLEEAKEQIKETLKRDLTNFFLDILNSTELFDTLKRRVSVSKSIKTIDSSTKIVYTDEEIMSGLGEFSNYDEVALDIETTGLNPLGEDADFISIAFSAGEKTIAFPLSLKSSSKELFLTVGKFISERKLNILHNAKFELRWFVEVFGESFLRNNFWADTMVNAYVLDERKGAFSLDDLCLYTFSFPLKKLSSNIDRSDLKNSKIEDVLRYNALDAKATFFLYKEQERELNKTPNLKNIANVTVDTTISLVLMEQKGVLVDTALVKEYSKKINMEIDELVISINNLPQVKAYTEKYGNLNYNSTQQLILLVTEFYNKKLTKVSEKGNKTIDKEVLENLALQQVEIAQWILKIRELSKLDSTYLSNIVPDRDGRLRTNFSCIFTATGRISSRSPNMQNFPKRENAHIRKTIIAKPGHKIVSIDYGQIEARVLAMASHDKRFTDAIWNNYDVHKEWALKTFNAHPKSFKELVLDLDYPTDSEIGKIRAIIKNKMVFPWFYLAQPTSVGRALGIPNNIIYKLFSEFWEYFEGIKLWQENLKLFYKKHGYVETLTGRRRRYPLDPTMIANTPIQGGASDIVVGAMNRLSKLSYELKKPQLQSILNVHDDLTKEIPIETLDDDIITISKEMVKPVFDFINVPLAVEIAVGDNWYELKKYKTLTSVDFGFMSR